MSMCPVCRSVPCLTTCALLHKEQQMSKIDVSEEIIEDGWGYTVTYKGKLYNYFSSRAGAEAYLEVLKRGEKERSDNGNEAEVVS